MGSTSQHICRHFRTRDRRKAAELREVNRALRTDEEQLALLDNRPGNSAKERRKLRIVK